jgi:hypothetical protein
MRPPLVDRDLLLVATLVILTGIALGMRAPLGGGAPRAGVLLAVPGGR